MSMDNMAKLIDGLDIIAGWANSLKANVRNIQREADTPTVVGPAKASASEPTEVQIHNQLAEMVQESLYGDSRLNLTIDKIDLPFAHFRLGSIGAAGKHYITVTAERIECGGKTKWVRRAAAVEGRPYPTLANAFVAAVTLNCKPPARAVKPTQPQADASGSALPKSTLDQPFNFLLIRPDGTSKLMNRAGLLSEVVSESTVGGCDAKAKIDRWSYWAANGDVLSVDFGFDGDILTIVAIKAIHSMPTLSIDMDSAFTYAFDGVPGL